MKIRVLVFIALLCVVSFQIVSGRSRKADDAKAAAKEEEKKKGDAEEAAAASTTETLTEQLPDDNLDGQSTSYEHFKAWAKHGLTEDEIREVFEIADQNKDGLLNSNEWKGFYDVFVTPFRTCDADKDWLLNEKEFAACMKSDAYLKALVADHSFASDIGVDPAGKDVKLDEIFAKHIMAAIDRTNDKSSNFAEYVSLRKAAKAWKTCTTGNYCTPATFKCTIDLIYSSHKIHLGSNDIEKIFVMGTVDSSDNDQMSFPVFLDAAERYGIFATFDQPEGDGYLTMKEMMKLSATKSFPARLSKEKIQQMFLALDPFGGKPDTVMDFATFVILTKVLDTINKNCAVRNNHLNKSEFLKFLDDKMVPKIIVENLDRAVVDVPQDMLEKASTPLEETKSLTEDDFIDFMQTSSKSFLAKREYGDCEKKNEAAKVSAIPKNEKARTVAFDVHDLDGDEFISFSELIRMYKEGWLFAHADSNGDGLVTPARVKERLSTYNPLIQVSAMEVDEHQKFAALVIDKPFDFLDFQNFFQAKALFFYKVIPDSDSFVTGETLKAIFAKMGYKMTERDYNYVTAGNIVQGEARVDWRKAVKVQLKTVTAAKSMMGDAKAAATGEKTAAKTEGDATEAKKK